MTHDHSEAEEAILAFIAENDVEALRSAAMKLELGMATPEEQVVMAQFMHRMRDLMNWMVTGDEV